MKKIIVFFGLLIAAAVALFTAFDGGKNSVSESFPTLAVRTVSADADGQIEVAIDGRSLTKGYYQAVSMVIDFDNEKLEFLGSEGGDILLSDGTLPEWECDPVRSSKTGNIALMWYDKSGGNCGFSPENDGCLMRLSFRVSDGVSLSGTSEISIRDAVFASLSGSMTTDDGTLKTVSGGVKIG